MAIQAVLVHVPKWSRTQILPTPQIVPRVRPAIQGSAMVSARFLHLTVIFTHCYYLWTAHLSISCCCNFLCSQQVNVPKIAAAMEIASTQPSVVMMTMPGASQSILGPLYSTLQIVILTESYLPFVTVPLILVILQQDVLIHQFLAAAEMESAKQDWKIPIAAQMIASWVLSCLK